jgi:TctA family transporter
MFERPVAMGFIVVALAMFAWPLWRDLRRQRTPADQPGQ